MFFYVIVLLILAMVKMFPALILVNVLTFLAMDVLMNGVGEWVWSLAGYLRSVPIIGDP